MLLIQQNIYRLLLYIKIHKKGINKIINILKNIQYLHRIYNFISLLFYNS
jgi:hypothetical protein